MGGKGGVDTRARLGRLRNTSQTTSVATSDAYSAAVSRGPRRNAASTRRLSACRGSERVGAGARCTGMRVAPECALRNAELRVPSSLPYPTTPSLPLLPHAP